MSLHRGIVIDVEDPAGQGRVNIEVPSVSTETLWALVVAPLAAGGLELPEVGTGVWVEFEGDDWSSPVVLGVIPRTIS
ncbi:phage baseplate assembly protein V [Microbacterium pumilum]|uniref:Gp5/Type VI secretion system Vgr protein OB-fold domain-containing protein n=1 Tax=Microbacterium pumilum TaxID=344165 RepID=A0ABN2SCN2_9MICO